jgi:hypothetical protein
MMLITSAPRTDCPEDMDAAHEVLGAACGHGAFAAALRTSVAVATFYFDRLKEGRSWVNMGDMEAALRKADVVFEVVGREWPFTGLALLQWTGPWTRPGVPARVACMHRHWVALRDRKIWDANIQEWLTHEDWNDFARELMPPKADGWTVARGYEITRIP